VNSEKRRVKVRSARKILKVVAIIVGVLLSLQYIVNPKYHFPQSTPFSGNYFYNPYQNIDTAKWRKANFHVHTRQWLGLTNGMKNTNELVDSIYSYLGYDIYCISDYQTINDYEKDHSWYIPVYEHAYMPSKNHQLVLNARSVTWLDYLFPQTLDNKQQIINALKEDTGCLVAIAHPHWQDQYAPEDFKYLCNYDLIEALNQNRFSFAYWDSALSNGHTAFILADDDAHDIQDIQEGGHCCTFINTALQKDSILAALKNGGAYGSDVDGPNNNSYSERKVIMASLGHLESVKMSGDTMTVRMSKKVKSFGFIGQNGVLEKKMSDVQEASYIFSKVDTYIRTEIKEEGGTTCYLNPVFRYDGKSVPTYQATVDVMKTWIWRLGFILIILLLINVRGRIAK
jgi:hypothetical protein